MKKVVRQVLVYTGLVLLSGCPKEQPQALFIMDAAAMTRQQQCSIRPGAGVQMLRPYGVLDLAITNSYWLFPRVKNMLPSLQTVTGEGVNNLQAETNYVNIHTAYVHVNPGGYVVTGLTATEIPVIERAQFDGFTWDVSASAGPGEETMVAIQVIPPDIGNILQAKMKGLKNAKNPAIWISVVVKLEARTQDLWTVYSNEFKFPILTCYGCLVRYVTNDPNEPPSVADVPCLPGQDDAVDNTLCKLIAMDKNVCFPPD